MVPYLTTGNPPYKILQVMSWLGFGRSLRDDAPNIQPQNEALELVLQKSSPCRTLPP